jgi:hypothetical protein
LGDFIETNAKKLATSPGLVNPASTLTKTFEGIENTVKPVLRGHLWDK